jgi:hypothetical protein
MRYKPENTANGNETGLFLHVLPKKSPCPKGEKFLGGKLQRKIDCFLYGFMSDEMEKPVLIRASKAMMPLKHGRIDTSH